MKRIVFAIMLIMLLVGAASAEINKATGEFLYRNPGADKFQGDLIQALKLLGFPSEAFPLFLEKVKKGEFESVEVRTGDKLVAMTFGKNKAHHNVRAEFKKKDLVLQAILYKVVLGNKEYRLLFPYVCGNWSRLAEVDLTPPAVEPQPQPKEEPKAPPPPPKVEAPKKPEPAPQEEQTQVIIRKVPQELKDRCNFPEAIVGAGVYSNDLAHGKFAYAEYMHWFQSKCHESEYWYGIGAKAEGDWGDSKIAPYDWKSRGAGIGAGVARYYFWRDSDGKKRADQWQLKAYLVYEHQEGKNSESGYEKHQNNWKVQVHWERAREFNDNWKGFLIADASYAFSRHFHSTWSGDSAGSRTFFSIGAYGQYKLNEDWQVRFGGGPFYQGWDRLWGAQFLAELRYKEFLMFGPYVNFFPFGGTMRAYGVSAGHLTTIGGFVRLEFGDMIRRQDAKNRAEKIRQIKPENPGSVAVQPAGNPTLAVGSPKVAEVKTNATSLRKARDWEKNPPTQEELDAWTTIRPGDW